MRTEEYIGYIRIMQINKTKDIYLSSVMLIKYFASGFHSFKQISVVKLIFAWIDGFQVGGSMGD